jgi:PHD/YefM family antitoxin component YafN of YafNO toxin-antitoxin module
MNLKQIAVLPTSEARSELSSIISRFRTEGSDSTPIYFGSHRKPEGVILPYSLWQELLEQLENIEIENIVLERTSDKSNPQPFDELVRKLGLKKPI